MAQACRILALNGHQDLTLGHVSARLPGTEIIYMKRKGRGLDEITPDDIIAIDLDGNLVEGEGEVHLEYPVHTEVYRRRPDVGAVIHTHSPYATALAATDGKLELLTHDAVLFYRGLPRFEDTPELIVNSDQGRSLAQALGDARAVLMRNHGVLVVGESVPWAVLAALTLDRAIAFQIMAARLGQLRPMTRAEAEKLFPQKFPQAFVEEYWNYLVRKLERAAV